MRLIGTEKTALHRCLAFAPRAVFPIVLALATDEVQLSVASSAKTAGLGILTRLVSEGPSVYQCLFFTVVPHLRFGV